MAPSTSYAALPVTKPWCFSETRSYRDVVSTVGSSLEEFWEFSLQSIFARVNVQPLPVPRARTGRKARFENFWLEVLKTEPPVLTPEGQEEAYTQPNSARVRTALVGSAVRLEHLNLNQGDRTLFIQLRSVVMLESRARK
jgi:hypothetical protein